MSVPSHYSAAQARRSLRHFALGKAASAVTGVVWLLWLVRLVPAAEYGTYVALLAVVEIFYLASGFGLSTMAQRYVAEFRVKAPASQFGRFVWGLLARRIVFAAMCATALALGLGAVLSWWGVALSEAARPWFLAWLLLGCVTRYLDELLPALLMQGVSQTLSMLANLLRLATAAWAVQAGRGLDHHDLVVLEAGVSAVLSVLGGVMLARYIARQPGAAQGSGHTNPGMWAVALNFYVVQLLGQAWSANAARLLVSRALGAVSAAAFGFALALVDMVRNYLPAYLLASWVRPLMVARYVQDGNLRAVHELANLVLKLSLMVLLPLVAYMAGHGAALVAWLSAGRFGPGMGALLAWLFALVGLQCAHVVVGMVSATVERARANLLATLLGCLALPVGAWFVPRWGVSAVVVALCGAEVLWIAIVMFALSRAGFGLRLHWPGLLRIGLAGAVAAVAMQLWPTVAGPMSVLPLLGSAVVGAGVMVWLRPLTRSEVALLLQALPAPWRNRWQPAAHTDHGASR